MKRPIRFSSFILLCPFIFLFSSRDLSSQNERNGIRLLVLISIDQFRYDYMARFKNFYSDSGFHWFRKRGITFTNAHHRNAVPLTASGHTAIATGTSPSESGVILNNWWDSAKKRTIYCMEDTTVGFVEAIGPKRFGQRSPANIKTKSIGDHLKEQSPDSKVYSISVKDRSAIPLGGKTANGAFWFDSRTGSFVTSTYYMKKNPLWLSEYNRERQADRYFQKEWTRILPEGAYHRCDVDDAEYELDRHEFGRTFPHPVTGGVNSPEKPFYEALVSSPFGDELLLDFARQLILGEQLGARGFTDILFISLSSLDEIGHNYGPNSHEVMDACIRLDQQIARLVHFLEGTVGLKNCCLLLTADHGVSPIPEYLQKKGIEAGRVIKPVLTNHINENLIKRFGNPPAGIRWIEATAYPWIYINREALVAARLSLPEFDTVIREIVTPHPGISDLFSREQIESSRARTGMIGMVRDSYDPKRAGDYFVLLKKNFSFWSSDPKGGAEHGMPYDDNLHVPLMLFAPNVPRGTVGTAVSINDIAPTLARILSLPPLPSGGKKILPVRVRRLK